VIVEETEQPGMSLSSVARKYDIYPNQLFTWRRLMKEGAFSAVRANEGVVPKSEVKVLKARIRELERMLGRKTMEAEILKEALEIAREKNCYCARPYPKRKIPREANYGDAWCFPFVSV